jgi:hypothetical protein
MLTIRRRRSTSLRHHRPASARSSGSRKDPKQPLFCPWFTPAIKCKLRLLKLDHVKDYLLMEEEFVAGQECLKPQEDINKEDRSKADDLRGSPMSVGNLEEIIDGNHAIVSSSVGPEYYVNVLSFLDKDQLEPGCAHTMWWSSIPTCLSLCACRKLAALMLCDRALLSRYYFFVLFFLPHFLFSQVSPISSIHQA